jgi:hypothetical protein
MLQLKQKEATSECILFFHVAVQKSRGHRRYPGGCQAMPEKAAGIWNVRKCQDCKDRVKKKGERERQC